MQRSGRGWRTILLGCTGRTRHSRVAIGPLASVRKSAATALLVVAALFPSILPAASAHAQALLLPEWRYEPGEHHGKVHRGAGYAAGATYDFVNDTVSDTWSVTKAPIHWGWRGWLTTGAIAGMTTAMIYTVDSDIRRVALGSEGFHDFGEGIRWVGNGPGLIALTGGFALTGMVFDRPKERETARLLLEASASGYLFTVAGKYTFGRSRPNADRGPRAFDPFSGEVSLPSGETTSAFIMAGVVTSQYPSWPVQLISYSLAGAVGAGRIALDAHWGSDVFVSAALGIAVSKAIVHFNRVRSENQRSSSGARRSGVRHFVQVSPRAFQWTMIY